MYNYLAWMVIICLTISLVHSLVKSISFYCTLEDRFLVTDQDEDPLDEDAQFYLMRTILSQVLKLIAIGFLIVFVE